MEKYCKKELCNGCSACVNICPKGCITMVPDAEGFQQPVIDETHCVDCGLCRKACPILRESIPASGETLAYAAINQDETVRQTSTSGGIFTLLSQWVMDRGGVVFGVGYNDRFEVLHYHAETAEALAKFRGAKYAQSRLDDTYKKVASCLKEDRYVLFSGTPCQIGGLVVFLGKEYEKLILVDLICHGVPSPKVWAYYIRYRSQQDAHGNLPSAINLRSKETGWPGYSIRIDYPGGNTYSTPNSQDPYLRGFVGNLYLRSSCYNCHFKGSIRQSDFTLGDYWGVWDQLPEYHDGKGTSLVLLHTQKAKQLWDEISQHMYFSEVNIATALTENPSATVSSPLVERRSEFFARYENEDFQALVEELLPKPFAVRPSFLKRILRKVKQLARKILPV